jgi:hypothetical protein
VDSVTHCDARVTAADVVVAGSFAGALAFSFVLPRGVRGLVAHEAGIGKDGAGISGLPLADRAHVPAAAVATMSARLGDGASVHTDGIVSRVNETARALGVAPGMPAAVAARAMLAAPPGRPGGEMAPLDRSARVVLESAAGRVVLLGSTSFVTDANRHDVLCVGSHGGRVNALPLLPVRPRGVIAHDGGIARDGSGTDGLPVLDAAGVAAATVGAMSARIGDPQSLYETGVISAVNDHAARAGVTPGQSAREAARLMLPTPHHP